MGADDKGRGGWIVAGMVAVLAVAAVGLAVVRDDRSDRWRHRGDGEEDLSHLVAAGDQVCATSGRELFCLDGASGEEVFTADLTDDGAGLTLAGDTLVVVADGGRGHGDVHGYSLDGEPLWDAEEPDDLSVDEVWEALPVAGAVVAVAGSGEDAIAIDARSGEELWQTDEFAGDLFSDGERFYGNGLDYDRDDFASTPVVVALDPESGDELWTSEIGEPDDLATFVQQTVALGDGLVGLVVESDEEAELVAVDTDTGEARWRLPVEEYETSVAHAKGVTVVVDGPDVHGYDESGSEVWQSRLPVGSDEELEHSELHVGDDGTIYAYEASVFLIDPTDGSIDAAIQDVWPYGVAAVADHIVLSLYDELVGVPEPD